MAPYTRTLGPVLVFLAFGAPLVACHSEQSEPPPPSPVASTAPTESGSINAAPRAPETHRIVFQDHRNVVPLRQGDRFVLPDDPAFNWRANFEDQGAFARVEDAGEETYRVTKSGMLRAMVFGTPKCRKSDAGCGLSSRRWDVTFRVQ